MQLSKWIQLTLLFLAYTAAVAFGYCIWGSNYDAVSTWAVSVTGAVVLWYTWETMRLRRVAYQQYEAQLRPFIVFHKNAAGKFVVENAGNGIALNISIEKIMVSAAMELEIRFSETVPYLKPNTSVEFKTQSYINGEKTDNAFNAHLDHQSASLSLDIRIHFSNVYGRRYSLVETITPGTLAITGFRDETAL